MVFVFFLKGDFNIKIVSSIGGQGMAIKFLRGPYCLQ